MYLGRGWATHSKYQVDMSRMRYVRIAEDSRSKLVLVPDLRSRRLVKDFFGVTRQVAMSFPYFLEDYDVIHIEYLFMANLAISAIVLKILQDTPHIIDFVDLIGQLREDSPRKSYKLYNLLYAVGYLPTWSTVCSDYLRSYLIKKGFAEQAVHKIPMGVDITKIRCVNKGEARERLKLMDTGYLMGYEFGTGRQDTYVDTILFSLREILKHVNGVKVVFIGDWAGSSNIARRKCISMGLEAYSVCTGPLETRDLSDWLAACDLLLLPLDDTPYDHARFPGRLGDYLAAGRPILGAAVGELTTVLPKGCGVLFKPGDHLDLASKILALIQDESRLCEMGKEARCLAENEYSWRNIAKHLESIYRKVASA